MSGPSGLRTSGAGVLKGGCWLTAQSPTVAPADLLVARQPIFDRQVEVVAYELLAREKDTDSAWTGGQASLTTARVIGQAFLDMDVWSITQGLPAYINFTRELLINGLANELPPELTVIELPEDIAADDEIRDACRTLRQAGYRLALDDVVADDPRLQLLPLVDIAKLDFGGTTDTERATLLECCRMAGVVVLAEKVETPEQYEEAKLLGCDVFQGYFFQRPSLVRGGRRSDARLLHLQLLRALTAAPVDVDVVGNLLARDRVAASGFVGIASGVAAPPGGVLASVRGGLDRLSQADLQRWISLMVVVRLGEHRPDQLVIDAVTRARFCEYLATRLGSGIAALDAHLVGLLSLLDALVSEPLTRVLGRVCSRARLRTAILYSAEPLGALLDLVIAYEHGAWDRVRRRADQLELSTAGLTRLYLDSLAWAERVTPEIQDTLRYARMNGNVR